MVFILASVLFWSSAILAPFTFAIAVIRKSWKWMLVSGATILPFCLYLLVGEPPVFWFGFLPIGHVLLAAILLFREKQTHKRNDI
jgi:hypothetical protein